MKRLIGILIISLALITACIFEELYVSKTIKDIKTKGTELMSLASGQKDINTEEIISISSRMAEEWKHKEPILCYLINYKDMSEMSNEIVRLNSYCQSNIKEEFVASLELVLYYCDTFNHITGFNLQNIF